MDPIEVIDLCRVVAHDGAPKDAYVPRVFSVADYEHLLNTNPKDVRKLLDDLICAEHPDEGLEMLFRFNVLHALFPELVAIRNLNDFNGSRHKDVWKHTKIVVSTVPGEPELRWGALFHDIGKARTRAFKSNGDVTFHNHDLVGARMVDQIQRRTRLFQDDQTLLSTVRALVLHHLRPASYNSGWSDTAVRRFINDCGSTKFRERLLILSRSDLTTRIRSKREKALLNSAELVARVEELMKIDEAPKLPKGTMGIILANSGRRPGPWLARVKAKLDFLLINGDIEPNMSPESYAELGNKMIVE